LEVVRSTTTSKSVTIQKQITAEEILYFQKLIRKVPVADNVLEYAVGLATKTRPNTAKATADVNNYLSWGAGPRASQFLVLGAKCHAALRGKYSPDIEDVRAVALPILRHRIVKNYKAEAEGISIDDLVKRLF
jgi:MoxR-like ATPase